MPTPFGSNQHRSTTRRRWPSVLFALLGMAAWLALASALPAGLALTEEQRVWLDEHPVIRLAPDPDFAPIESLEDGEYRGIAADYAALVEDALGIEFEIVPLPSWQEVVAAAQSREIDMFGAAMESPERSEYMLFTDPHIQTAAIIVVREGTAERLTLEQMAGQRVAVVEGYVVEEHLRTHHPQVTPVPVSSTLDALRAVSYGEVDAMVGDEATASHVIQEAGITNLRVAGEVGLTVDLAIASRSDWPELNQLLNEALASIPSAERRAIRQRWIHLSPPAAGPPGAERVDHEINLTADERQWLADHPVIRLGPYADYPPAEFVDESGEHRGIAADYVRLIEQRLGITFTHVHTETWQDLMDAAKAREVDVLALIARTPDRMEYLEFTEPYLELPAVIIAQTGTGDLEPHDLDGRRVAVVEGYAVQEYLENTFPEMVLVPVPDNVEGLRIASTGGVAAFISDLGPVSYLIEREGISNLTVVGESGFVYRMGLASRSDWPTLNLILDKALATITPEERQEIRRRWITVDVSGRLLSRQAVITLLIVLGTIGLFAIGIFVWNRALARVVRERTAQLEAELERRRQTEEELARHRDHLEEMVAQRTAELERTNTQLTGEIAERRAAEKSLRKLNRAVEQSSSVIVITDTQGTIEYVNPAFTEMTEFTAEEAIGQNPRILQSGEHPPAFYADMWRTIKSGEVWRGDFCNRKKSGELFFESASIAPVRDETGEITHFVAVKDDITERLEHERELQKARAAAETANAAKSEFLANMSHEIRTPMNAILGFSDLLRQSSLTDKEKAHLDAIRSSGKALLALINDILDLSKVEAGKLEIQHEAFSLRRLLTEIQTLFGQKAVQRGIELRLDIDPEMPEWIFLDEIRLRQILFNIVGNAMKFTHEGSVTVRARGTVDPLQTDHMHLVLEVQDTGIGIPPDQQARIFESFSQVSGQSTRKYGGTGLGLAISRRLTEMMGGTVSLESEAGVGSTFRFEFPEVTLTAPQEVEDDGVQHRLDDLKPAKILCADDEPLNRALIEGYFEGTGHTLLLAENGKEAVELTERERPDLILMDIRMPVMSGIEATELIKSRLNIPVLALTASSMTGERNLVEEVCDMHLSKPISTQELAKALKAYLPVRPDRVPTAAAPTPSTAAAAEAEAEALDTSRWPDLLTLLQAELEGDWKTLCETPNMDELEAFGNRLREWSEEHAAPPLARYAQRLLQRVEEFDIDKLPATVRAFAEVVEEIKKGVEPQ